MPFDRAFFFFFSYSIAPSFQFLPKHISEVLLLLPVLHVMEVRQNLMYTQKKKIFSFSLESLPALF